MRLPWTLTDLGALFRSSVPMTELKVHVGATAVSHLAWAVSDAKVMFLPTGPARVDGECETDRRVATGTAAARKLLDQNVVLWYTFMPATE